MRSPHPRASRRPLVIIAVVGALLSALLFSAPSAAAAPALSVSPASGVAVGATVSVSGSGYSPTANNGVGIYVAWCKLVAQYWTKAENCGDARWVHVGGGGAAQAVMSAAGSFSTNLTLAGQVAGTDCTVPGACKVVTMAAHGSSDRSQDAVVGVTFASVAPPPPPVVTSPATTAPKTTAAGRTTSAPASPPTTSAAIVATTPAATSTPPPTPPSTPSPAASLTAASTTSGERTAPSPTLSPAAAEKSGGSAAWPWVLPWVLGGLALLGSGAAVAWRRRSPPTS
jgi:hypothetical protein